MSKRSIDTTLLANDDSVPWCGLPEELIDHIHSFISVKESSIVLKLLRVSKHYYQRVEDQVKSIVARLEKMLKNEHNDLIAFRCNFNKPVSHANIMFDIDLWFKQLFDTTTQATTTIALSKTLSLFCLFEEIDAAKCYLFFNEFSESHAQAGDIYYYDAKNQSCKSLVDVPEIRRIINMPPRYTPDALRKARTSYLLEIESVESRIRAIATESKISDDKRELLLMAAKRANGMSNFHWLSHLALGKTAQYGRVNEKTLFCQLVWLVDAEKEKYTSILANHMKPKKEECYIHSGEMEKKDVIRYLPLAVHPEIFVRKAMGLIFPCYR